MIAIFCTFCFASKGKKPPSTPVSLHVMKRILNLFELTKQDEALMDTLVAFEKIREAERCQPFFPLLRDSKQSSGSDFETDSSPPCTPPDVESSDESLTGENMQEIDQQFVEHLEELPMTDSTSTLSTVVPSITDDESIEK